MHSAAAHVRQRRDCVLGNVVLHIEMPLLHVGPRGFVWDGNKRQRSCAPAEGAGIEIGVTRHIHDAAGLGVDIVLFQRLGVALIAIRVLEEDAVTAADGPPPVAQWIIRKTKAGRRVPPVVAHATSRNAWPDPTVYPP